MRFPLAIGAVVDGVPTTAQTPLSGQTSPVRAVDPMGAIAILLVFDVLSCVPDVQHFKG
jgi:hypothetical protein